jgi:hypothetical protein
MTIRNVMKTVQSIESRMCERIDRSNGVPTSIRYSDDKPKVYYAGGLSPKEQYLRDQAELKNAFRS